MWIVLALLCAFLGLVLLVVLLPFRARATGSVHDGAPAGEARVDWALGLLSVDVAARRAALRVAAIPVARFDLATVRERKKEERRRARPREPRREKRKPGTPARARAVLAEREALRGIAARLARALHLRVRARGTVGTGDPADTAALIALAAALGALPGVELALGADWMEEALELDVELAARIWIAELLVVAAAVLLARRNRRALRAAFGRLPT
ncbi:hypothetical protein AMOR_18610 [Anaeromyxobacter oryzae]|uniref:DUF2953 domain-containing protein n=2 Tax=Anaeromyxobacter oryzae TaxID=2918170 RepID=A0ABM7WTR0_9BACT|nr:hypothetical protein AMOR_18610 [Anaeromyxobacter oryzae]